MNEKEALQITLEIVLEYNENGCLAYIQNLVGAFTHGRTEEESFAKLAAEPRCFEH